MSGWNGRKIKRLANEVISMYGPVCWLCGLPIDLTLSRRALGGLTIDHVVPRSKGGTDDLVNLRPAHYACNCSRQDKPASAFRPPRKPLIATDWPGLA